MFDRIVAARNVRRSWRAVFFSLSIVTHAAALVGLLAMAMWQIDKLAPPERQVALLIAPRIPSPPAPRPPSVLPHPPQPRRPRDLTQPVEVTVPVDPVADTSGDTLGPADGDPSGIAGGDGDCLTCLPATTQVLPDMARIEPPEPPKPRVQREVVAHQVLVGHRIAGNEQIHPPDAVLHEMMRDGRDRLHGVIKMCLDTRGQVSSLDVTRSTGYSAYDDELVRQMREWRYEPYQSGGQPVAVCSAVDFIFVMR